MTRQITLTTQFELGNKIPPPDKDYALSLNLGFSSETMPDDGAHQDFKEFLGNVMNARFSVFEFAVDHAQAITFWKPNIILDTAPLAVPAGLPLGIDAWLGDRLNPKWSKPSPGQVVPGGNPPETTVVEHHAVASTHLLAASANWNAPLPQVAGLTRLGRLTSPADFDPRSLIIVPWFPPAVEPDLAWIQAHFNKVTANNSPQQIDVEITGIACGTMPDVVLRTQSVQLPKPEVGSLVDEASGFLQVNPRARELSAALTRIREQSSSVLWAYPVIAGTDLKPREMPDAGNLKRAIWLGITGLVTMLDPILIALTMGGSNTKEGPFVSALIAALEEKNESAANSFKTDLANALITDAILALSEKAPHDLAPVLANLFKLDPLPDAKRKVFDEAPDLLPMILTLYAKYNSGNVDQVTRPDASGPAIFDLTTAATKFTMGLERQVLSEIARLARMVQDETLVNNMVSGIIAKAGTDPAEIGIDSTWISKHLSGSAGSAPITECKQALDAATQHLSGIWLDAIRHAVGLVFESTLVSIANAIKPGAWDDRDLRQALIDTPWFRLRVTAPAATPPPLAPLAALAATLHCVDRAYLDADAETILSNALDHARDAANDDLFPGTKIARFMPETRPRDLPIQIDVAVDTDNRDTFPLRFNGVSVLVRREREPWSYANLAELTLAYPADGLQTVDRAIHPLQSVPVDGQQQIVINYAGLPFASSAFSETHLHDAYPNPDDDESLQTFYKVNDPTIDQTVTPHDRLLPALAYGYTYSVAAHVVTKGGTLPVTLQLDPATPWLPTFTPDIPAGTGRNFEWTEPYRRTTSIGRVSLVEKLTPGAGGRIGRAIDDTVSLSSDFPKVVLAAPDNLPAMLDLLRNADGTGVITLPKTTDETFELLIDDVWWWGQSGSVAIEILNQPNAVPDDVGAAKLDHAVAAPFVGGSIALRISVTVDGAKPIRVFSLGFAISGDAPPIFEEVLRVDVNDSAPTLGGAAAAWLRLRVMGPRCAMSFADPTHDVQTNDATSRRLGASLVLVANKQDNAWLQGVTDNVSAILQFSRVGFLDFDRWFSNKARQQDLFPEIPNKPNTADSRARAFHAQIMTAYIARTSDSGLAQLIDAMPDPAVTGLRLELAAVDGLCKKPSEIVATEPPNPVVLAVVPLGTVVSALSDKLGPAAGPYAILQGLSMAGSANLAITCDGSALSVTASANVDLTEPSRVTINVPSGMTARLSVQAMVPDLYFGDVLALELAQLAVRHANGFYYFEGPALTIEGMCMMPAEMDDASAIDLVRAMIEVVPAGEARSYDLVARPRRIADERRQWMWRQLGSVEVRTQRWRFMGRPIHNWIDPKNGKSWPNPARDIELVTPGLAAFEREAFFDRDAIDAELRVQQLQPTPHATILQSFPWNLPSAMMFRHRVTLRSRYVGAMRSSANGTRKGYSRDPRPDKPEDWIRGAILADRTRLQLTRPQLRALLPLTTTPTEQANDTVAPPVMAILEEHPFAYGGLADRISAEIRTGFGFGFEGSNVVHAFDTRKEFGPDPRLSYWPTPDQEAQGLTLESEGPIGLTFDTPTSAAPAFANTAFLLRPQLATDDSPASRTYEEHFVSVALRRYLDPLWLPGGGSMPSLSEPCWVEIGDAATMAVAGGSEPLTVLGIDKDHDIWTARVNSHAVDPMPPPVPSAPIVMMLLARASTDLVKRLAILHLPLEEGRASLTLFALRGEPSDALSKGRLANIAAGDNNLPRVLASFEWKIPDGSSDLVFGPMFACYPTSASPTTQMNWTRTGRSFDFVDAYDQDSNQRRMDVTTLDVVPAHSNSGALNFVDRFTNYVLHIYFKVESNPLYVHRHLAILSTVKAPGIGRLVEVYDAAVRILGNDVPIDPAGKYAIRILSFETPARPVVMNFNDLPEMSFARFDVDSILGDKYVGSVPPRGLNFTFRPLGDSSGDVSCKSLTFTLKYSTPSNQTVNQSFTIDSSLLIGGKAPLHAVHFSICDKQINWRCVFTDGSRLDNPPIGIQDAICLSNSHTVTITPTIGMTNPREYWADISMLTSTDGNLTNFSWDWLFTGGDLEASAAVTPIHLMTIAEAEGRIISISPPIPVAAAK